MTDVIKINYNRKVRYLSDKDTEECNLLADLIMDHYGEFLPTPQWWDVDSISVYEKVLRNCGLSVNEFLEKTFVIATPKPKKKRAVRKKRVVKEKPVVTEEKVPVKKPVVTKKKTPVKKKTVKKVT